MPKVLAEAAIFDGSFDELRKPEQTNALGRGCERRPEERTCEEQGPHLGLLAPRVGGRLDVGSELALGSNGVRRLNQCLLVRSRQYAETEIRSRKRYVRERAAHERRRG